MTARKVSRTPERFIDANGLTFCYETFGRRKDPALLLIMGMGAQMIGWEDDFCEALAGRGFYVVRFDNRDVGRSTHLNHLGVPHIPSSLVLAWWGQPVKAPYRLYDMALDVTGLLDALGIEAAHVVGLSMGGTIGQTLAIHFPQRLRSLTSIMSTTGDADLPRPRPWALNLVMRASPPKLEEYVEQYVRTWRDMRVMGSDEDDRRDRLRAARNHARGLNPAGGARHLMAILASGSRRKALAQVTVPTLVIHGDADPLVPLEAGLDTARSIPGAQMMVIEGMGHALPVRTWVSIIDAVSRHAQQVDGQNGAEGLPVGR